MKPRINFIVTAGPTREHIDPVRFLSNPSTGRMGFAVAEAAAQRENSGVSLITGPVALKTPPCVKNRINVTSARDMLAAVENEIKNCNKSVIPCDYICLIMTAAVADWRPAECADKKLKKGEMSGVLNLVRNPDILKTINEKIGAEEYPNIIRVGFAAETGEPVAEAARKCREKGLAFVVANDVTEKGCGFGTKTNRVTFVFPDGRIERSPLLSKKAIARRIIKQVESIVNRQS